MTDLFGDVVHNNVLDPLNDRSVLGRSDDKDVILVV